jgi:hypothetical protein
MVHRQRKSGNLQIQHLRITYLDPYRLHGKESLLKDQHLSFRMEEENPPEQMPFHWNYSHKQPRDEREQRHTR